MVTHLRYYTDPIAQYPLQLVGPSHALVRSLLTLSEKLRSLGIVYHPVKQHVVIPDALRLLFNSLLDVVLTRAEDTTLHDLAFIRKFCELYGPTWTDLHSQIDRRLNAAVSVGVLLRISLGLMNFSVPTAPNWRWSHLQLLIISCVVKFSFRVFFLPLPYQTSIHPCCNLVFHPRAQTILLAQIWQNLPLVLVCS